MSILEKGWFNSYRNANQRCNYPKDKMYRYYGGKGIKFKLTLIDMEKLWERDKAYKMSQPTIDRINSKRNYTFSNCRFIERAENTRRMHKKRLKILK